MGTSRAALDHAGILHGNDSATARLRCRGIRSGKHSTLERIILIVKGYRPRH